ncbi:MAG: helix-turn-helix transcriptional regulator [Burkholderiales bacterium]|jgi:XRE family aerobic/anaerobic benzoate catabolism transcriptional regulator
MTLPNPPDDRDPFLVSLGERARSLRARRGMTRRVLSQASGVSERHLANLELGVGNASVLVLRQVSQALGASLAELIGDETASSPEWILIRELLRGRAEDELRGARLALADHFGVRSELQSRSARIALIGLRGAGKSTLGRMLADELRLPFVELNREIEQVAGCSLDEIHNLLGPAAYRRYELRALEETIQRYPEAVIATPGGIVSDAASYNMMLSHCFTVWLKATPEEHMRRVVAQGDLRPMSGNREAMDDLRRIIEGRAAFYGRADLQIDTSHRSLAEAYAALRTGITETLGR